MTPLAWPPDEGAVLAAVLDRLDRGAPGLEEARLAAIGWATLELDRAVAAFAPIAFSAAAPDRLLGARALVGRPTEEGPALVLLEPSTEGRLAAHLARSGEGPAVAYLDLGGAGLARAAEAFRARGASLRSAVDGPLGAAIRIAGGWSAARPLGWELILVAVERGTIPPWSRRP